jgi:hypothetical protein
MREERRVAEHRTNTMYPIVETAIRNGSSPASVFIGEVVMLQVRQPQACAMILGSPRFQAMLLGHIPPGPCQPAKQLAEVKATAVTDDRRQSVLMSTALPLCQPCHVSLACQGDPRSGDGFQVTVHNIQ